MKTISLAGTWDFRQAGCGEARKATVPGSVLHDLLKLGLIDDPFWRDNEEKTLETLRRDYEYSRVFDLTSEELAAEHIELVFHGLDTFADVTLNDKTILRADDMHRTWRVDVKNLLRAGENRLSIHFRSAAVEAERLHKADPFFVNENCLPGFEQVRKCHSMFGWDWGPKLPDMGVFRDVEMCLWDKCRIEDVIVHQHHENSAVTLRLDTKLIGEGTLSATLTAPDGTVIHADGKLAFHIDDPELWWPNGCGEQPLYTIRVALSDGSGELDAWERRIGLRTVTVDTSPDEWGSAFTVVVNGVPIFCMGANYIPEDNLLPRVTEERSRKLLSDCVRANYNMIRVWGGGYYPDDWFYDICDELGLLVWQDLLFACAAYRLTDRFVENITAETRDNIRRLRHHPSIALWCGSNELEEAHSRWGSYQSIPRGKADYVKQFECILPGVAKAEDPDRFYWFSSPSSGGGFDDPCCPDRGDVHFWEVWHGLKPFTEYRKYHFRFCSEFGFQSFPSVKTIESFTLPEDRNVFSDVMECHQKNPAANGLIVRYMADRFLCPTSLRAMVYGSEVLQAEAMKYGVEHWRANRGRCMGSLYWQLNDCWPVASWSSIDYYGRWKPLHYYAKKFYAPLLLTAIDVDRKVSLVVCSERRRETRCTVHWQLRTASGETLSMGGSDTTIPALGSAITTEVDCAPYLTTKSSRQSVCLAYQLLADGEMVYDSTLLFTKPKFFRFGDPKIALSVREEESRFVLTLTAEKYAKYVWIEHPELDFIASDNCVDLIPGEARELVIEKADLSRSSTAEELEKMTVLSAYDIR